MHCRVSEVFAASANRKISLPVFASRVAAGFPSPADDYIEGKIDLNRELIDHPLSTFYVRVQGDSMETTICQGDLLVIDRMPETRDGDIVVAWYEGDFCVKRLRVLDDGSVWLFSDNVSYSPIKIEREDDFEIWGLVLHSIQSFRKRWSA